MYEIATPNWLERTDLMTVNYFHKFITILFSILLSAFRNYLHVVQIIILLLNNTVYSLWLSLMAVIFLRSCLVIFNRHYRVHVITSILWCRLTFSWKIHPFKLSSMHGSQDLSKPASSQSSFSFIKQILCSLLKTAIVCLTECLYSINILWQAVCYFRTTWDGVCKLSS